MIFSQDVIEQVALSMYEEPCRICGETLTLEDITNGAVYAGYSLCGKSRSVHVDCWEKHEAGQKPKSDWAFPEDDQDGAELNPK